MFVLLPRSAYLLFPLAHGFSLLLCSSSFDDALYSMVNIVFVVWISFADNRFIDCLYSKRISFV